ncbi:MAG: hypothetical protein A2Z16_03875 [Chloroflexi bacterium RBG_16_54_18]|nr:MAG: hypothetical protein A2Z16_03875 [Chloroflexi bacterium RBG_16_54_18]
MRFKSLYNGYPIPVIGQGTWRLGGGMQPDTSQDEMAVRAIQDAIELGYTHIDTAEMYGGGHTEQLVAQAVRPFQRSQLFIASKLWKITQDPQDTLLSLEGSMRRLETDYLDLYLIHRPNQDEPMEAAFEALNTAASQGQVRHLGVSNFSLQQLRKAETLADMPLAAIQVPYSLHQRRYQSNGVIPYCQQHAILVVAYSPLDRGYLVEDPLVKRIAGQYGATPAQLALSWLVRQPQVAALPMSTQRAHLEENLKSLELELSPDDIQALDHIELPEDRLWPV